MNLFRIYFVLIFAVVGISLSAIFVKFTSAPPEITAFYRLLITFVISLPLVVKTKKENWKKLKKKDYLLTILSAAFLAFHFIAWFASLNYTSVTSSTVLVNIQPIFVILFSFLIWRSPIKRHELISVALAVAGIVVLSWGDFALGADYLFGNTLALVGAILIAGHYLCTSYLRNKMDTITYTTLLYGYCTVILGSYALFTGASFVGYTGQDYLMFFLLAVCCTVLGHTLVSWCLKFLSTTLVSLAILGEPIVAAVLAYFLLQENITTPQVLGSILILISIGYYIRHQSDTTTNEESTNDHKEPTSLSAE